MVNALRENGAKVIPYLPDRAGEGHGLNIAAVESLHTQGVSLMVTVDCGVTSEAEVARASELGIDTIITDHHSLSNSMPDAWAVVNPRRPDSRYPYDGLTGAGLSFKLAEGIWASLGLSEPKYLYELAALGTVADVGPVDRREPLSGEEGPGVSQRDSTPRTLGPHRALGSNTGLPGYRVSILRSNSPAERGGPHKGCITEPGAPYRVQR